MMGNTRDNYPEQSVSIHTNMKNRTSTIDFCKKVTLKSSLVRNPHQIIQDRQKTFSHELLHREVELTCRIQTNPQPLKSVFRRRSPNIVLTPTYTLLYRLGRGWSGAHGRAVERPCVFQDIQLALGRTLRIRKTTLQPNKRSPGRKPQQAVQAGYFGRWFIEFSIANQSHDYSPLQRIVKFTYFNHASAIVSIQAGSKRHINISNDAMALFGWLGASSGIE